MLLADREECKFLIVIAERLLGFQVSKFPPGFWAWTMKDKIYWKEVWPSLPMKQILFHFISLIFS